MKGEDGSQLLSLIFVGKLLCLNFRKKTKERGQRRLHEKSYG